MPIPEHPVSETQGGGLGTGLVLPVYSQSLGYWRQSELEQWDFEHLSSHSSKLSQFLRLRFHPLT